jgi:hypothetical protein
MVNEWNKSALVAESETEFETMLRRRLRSGAAPVAACAGFDIDAASAYLEGAVGGSHRAGYESHLAGCVTCRRHLIELARLAQCEPPAEVRPVSAQDRIPVWGRLKGTVAAWFDISSRGFKWQIASATGAAFAILIAALGVQAWKQVSKHSARTVADKAIPSNQAGPVEIAAQPIQSSTPEPSPRNEASSDTTTSIAQEPAAIQPEAAQGLAPKPLVGPQGNDPKFSVEAKNQYMSLPMSSNQQVEAPVAPKPMPSVAQAGQSSQLLYAPLMETRSESNAQRLSGRLEELEELAAAARMPGRKAEADKDPVQNLRSSPQFSRVKSVPPDPVVRSGVISSFAPKEQETPDRPSRIKSIVNELMKKNPLKWPFGSDSDQKLVADEEKSSDAESLSLMEYPFRDKVFVRKNGVWIDKEYNSEMQEWRRRPLTRGSEQYKRVLAEEPQLKAFFEMGPIIIVWKNRIYKVQ